MNYQKNEKLNGVKCVRRMRYHELPKEQESQLCLIDGMLNLKKQLVELQNSNIEEFFVALISNKGT